MTAPLLEPALRDDLLHLWFGGWSDDEPLAEDDRCMSLWWRADPAVDIELRSRFEKAHLEQARDAVDGWDADAGNAVARVLLLDQIPRNIYRGTAHMFATDTLAQRAARTLLDRQIYRKLPPIHRYFVLMPLMHAEDLASHDRATAAFSALKHELARATRSEVYAMALDFEDKHRAIIERFGRYPHRNALLGRRSTAEELAFLEEPGSSF